MSFRLRRSETPTHEDPVRLDRKRKKGKSHKDWKSPGEEDGQGAKMKDERTLLAFRAKHAVDLDTGMMVASRSGARPSCGTAIRFYGWTRYSHPR